MTRPSADVREAELLQKLSDIARMKVDAEPFGNDTLEIEAPPPDDAIFLTVLSESVHNWAPTASRSVHANVFTRSRPAPARRDIIQLTPSSAERARRERRRPKASTPEELPPLTH
jgi:hypothetical protein